MICGHGHEQKFKYPYPRDSKIIQMPYPRAKAIDQIPALCPASLRRLDIDRCITRRYGEKRQITIVDQVDNPTKEWVRGLPTDPSTDNPPNKIKNKISRTACPIDHSRQRNFARYAGLRWVNVTDVGSVSSASYVIVDNYIFAIFVAVALRERPGSPRNL